MVGGKHGTVSKGLGEPFQGYGHLLPVHSMPGCPVPSDAESLGVQVQQPLPVIGVFQGLPNPFEAIRYHSLAVTPESVPDCLEVTAHSDSGVIMGVRHREYPIEGIQFHPESIMTSVGKDLLKNFLDMPS